LADAFVEVAFEGVVIDPCEGLEIGGLIPRTFGGQEVFSLDNARYPLALQDLLPRPNPIPAL